MGKKEFWRGDIVFVHGIHGEGHEVMKDRPGIIVSNPAACKGCKALQVVPLTTAYRPTPYHAIMNDDKTALCEQIMTVDISRLEWKGHLTKQEMYRVNEALARVLQLDEAHRI